MTAVHVAAVSVAVVSGVVLLIRSKGTSAHRRTGWIYVVALAATSASSFGIYELRDGLPSVFHVVSVVIVGVLAAGLVAIRRARRPRLHLLFMATSFLMMVVTGIAQFFDRLPLPSDALNAVVFLQIPSVVGFALIWRASQRTPVDASRTG